MPSKMLKVFGVDRHRHPSVQRRRLDVLFSFVGIRAPFISGLNRYNQYVLLMQSRSSRYRMVRLSMSLLFANDATDMSTAFDNSVASDANRCCRAQLQSFHTE